MFGEQFRRIKIMIKRKITFHKKAMFIGSLYGCFINHEQNAIINEMIDILDIRDKLTTKCIKAIKNEIRYHIKKGIPFNIVAIQNGLLYFTKIEYNIAKQIHDYFECHPIANSISHKVISLYNSNPLTNSSRVEEGLIALTRDMNVNIGASATKLPLFLYRFWWNYSEFGTILEENTKTEDVVNQVALITPVKLVYTNFNVLKSDIRNIFTFVREKLC
jgi:hypothetical protein